MKIMDINKIYYINLILLMFKIYYSTSDIFQIPKMLSLGITMLILMNFFVSLIIKTLLHKFTIKKFIITYVLLAMALYSSYITEDYNIILSYFLIIGIEDIEITRVLKIILKFNIIMLSIHILLFCLNGIISFKDIEIYYNSLGKIRYNFFLGHPNIFAILMVASYTIYVYLHYEKLKLRDYLLGIILSLFIYLFPKSKTSASIIVVFILMVILAKQKKKGISIILKLLSKYIFTIISILILLYLFQYKNFDNKVNAYINEINTLLSGRIWYSEKAYEKYEYTLFGQYVEYETETIKYNKNIILDNFYVKMIINYGVIFLLIISIWFIVNNKYMCLKDYVYVILFSIIGVFEFHISNACIGVTLLIVANAKANKDLENKMLSSNCNQIGNEEYN